MIHVFVHVLQESPTGELADFTFSTGTEESPEFNASDHQAHPDPELDAQVGATLCDSEETDGSSEKGEFARDIKTPHTRQVDLSLMI